MPPLRQSIAPAYQDYALAPCYASHLPELVRPPVSLWVHGHVHDTCDYEVAGTRVVTNSRGYRPPKDNPSFDPARVIEV